MTDPVSAASHEEAAPREQAASREELVLRDVAQKLDEVRAEVRRQGRAAIAAQAAAEQCLEALSAHKVSRQGAPLSETERNDSAHRHWLETVIPIADSLDRVIAQARALARGPSPARRSLDGGRWLDRWRWPFAWWSRTPAPATDADSEAADADSEAASANSEAAYADSEVLLDALRILRSQLRAALGGMGVTVLCDVNGAVDPSLHRVVEVRGSGGAERVVETVRPGYILGEVVIREADVVVRRGSLGG